MQLPATGRRRWEAASAGARLRWWCLNYRDSTLHPREHPGPRTRTPTPAFPTFSGDQGEPFRWLADLWNRSSSPGAGGTCQNLRVM